MNVVASTFGSPDWAGMVPHARALADAVQGQLTVLHIDGAEGSRTAPGGPGESAATIHDTVRAIEPTATVEVLPTAPESTAVVSEIARATGAAVVAMRTQPAGRLQEFMSGGPAAKLLDGPDVPVMLGCAALQPPRLPYRLMVAVDDTVDAERAVQAASELLASVRVPVSLTTTYFDVLGDGPVPGEANARRERLETLAARLPPGLEVDVMVERGDRLETIQDQLLAAAVRWGASAIVVARRPRSRFSQALAGSTSLAILRQSPVPLLFAPPARTTASPRAVGREKVEFHGWRSVPLRVQIPGLHLAASPGLETTN